MNNNPFGLPESATDRFLREERERARLLHDAFGGSAIVEAARQARQHHELRRGLDLDAPYRGILDTLERERASIAAFKSLASNGWALSVQETARSIAQQNGGLFAQQRDYAGTVLDTIRAFDANRRAVTTALAAASAGETYRRAIAEALPRFSMFGAIAERMLVVDTMTLRASEGVVETATAMAARTVIEAQRIAEAIAQAPTDAEGARLYGSLLDLLVDFFGNLGPNTIAELQKMGLVGFVNTVIGILALVLSAYALIPGEPVQSPQDKAAFVELNRKVDHLQEETRRYHAAEARIDQDWLAGLSRAELVRDAILRRTPARAGDVVFRAPEGMEVAIERADGRWRLVVFRDPLSMQLARGWIYATAVRRLAPPPGPDGQ